MAQFGVNSPCKADIRPYPTINGERRYCTLVCGRIKGNPERPFTALVKEHRRRHNASRWFFRSDARVERLALSETAALLDACEAAGR